MNLFFKKYKIVLQIILVVFLIVLSVYLGNVVKDSEHATTIVKNYGYVGIFVLGLIGGFNLLVPIPIITFLPTFMSAGLNQWLIFLCIAVGATIADMLAFWLGRVGYDVSEGRINMGKLKEWQEKYYWLPLVFLFLFATFAPLPNEVLLIPLGLLGYRLKWIFPIVLFGNFAFNTLAGLGLLNLVKIIS